MHLKQVTSLIYMPYIYQTGCVKIATPKQMVLVLFLPSRSLFFLFLFLLWCDIWVYRLQKSSVFWPQSRKILLEKW